MIYDILLLNELLYYFLHSHSGITILFYSNFIYVFTMQKGFKKVKNEYFIYKSKIKNVF